ncbi:hypothetical protein B0H14DRAFT_3177760 [Mycena olivaceomarginata]|nr:hypothetical protein B0H14DRAFT_3177760 [Mycena olivaceomarginata]
MTFQIGTRFAVNQRLCCIFFSSPHHHRPCHSSSPPLFTKSTLNQPAKFRGAFRVCVVDLRYAAAAASSPAPALIVPGNFGPSHCPRPPRRDENTPHTRPRVQFPLPIYFAVPVAAVLRKNRPRAYETGGLGGAAGVHDPLRTVRAAVPVVAISDARHCRSRCSASLFAPTCRPTPTSEQGGSADGGGRDGGIRARQPVRRRRVWRGPPTSLPAFSCRPTPALEQGGGAGGGGRDGGIPGAGGACSGGMNGARIAHRRPCRQLPHQSRAAVRAAEGGTAGRQDPVASGRIRVWSGGGAGRVLAGRAAPHLPANFIWKIFYYSFWQFIPKCRESDSIGNDCQDGWTGSFDANNEQQRVLGVYPGHFAKLSPTEVNSVFESPPRPPVPTLSLNRSAAADSSSPSLAAAHVVRRGGGSIHPVGTFGCVPEGTCRPAVDTSDDDYYSTSSTSSGGSSARDLEVKAALWAEYTTARARHIAFRVLRPPRRLPEDGVDRVAETAAAGSRAPDDNVPKHKLSCRRLLRQREEEGADDGDDEGDAPSNALPAQRSVVRLGCRFLVDLDLLPS